MEHKEEITKVSKGLNEKEVEILTKIIDVAQTYADETAPESTPETKRIIRNAFLRGFAISIIAFSNK